MPNRPNPAYQPNDRAPNYDPRPTLHSQSPRSTRRVVKAAQSSAGRTTRASMGIPSEQWIATAAKGIKPGPG